LCFIGTHLDNLPPKGDYNLRRRNLTQAINSVSDLVQNPAVAAQPPPYTDRATDTQSVHSENSSSGETPSEVDPMADGEERDPNLNTGPDDAQDSDDDNADFVPRTLKEFNVPRAGDVKGAIRLPRIAGQQPNFNPGVVNLVQQNTFHGLDHEDPHAHIQTFLEFCTTVKINRAPTDYIRLALFPFTLKDKTKKWFGSLPRDSITTWRGLSKLFLTRFFPHKRTAKIRAQLTSFKQRCDEPLNET
jgi:Retrotransposon gag protein